MGGMDDPGASVACRMHGPMIYRAHLYRWACLGFDGEGCANYLNAEEVRRLLDVVTPEEPQFPP
jgi:hypothetical protein